MSDTSKRTIGALKQFTEALEAGKEIPATVVKVREDGSVERTKATLGKTPRYFVRINGSDEPLAYAGDSVDELAESLRHFLKPELINVPNGGLLYLEVIRHDMTATEVAELPEI